MCWSVHLLVRSSVDHFVIMSKNSPLFTTEEQFTALKVIHAQAQILNEPVIHIVHRWGWELGRGKERKWTAFTCEDEFFFAILTQVECCDWVWYGSRHYWSLC